jgi:hypothetical protein
LKAGKVVIVYFLRKEVAPISRKQSYGREETAWFTVPGSRFTVEGRTDSRLLTVKFKNFLRLLWYVAEAKFPISFQSKEGGKKK